MRDKLEFYALLTTVNLKKAEYLAKLIDQGEKPSIVANAANAINEISKNNVGNMNEIFANINIVHSPSNLFGIEEKREALNKVVSLLGYEKNNKPKWVDIISQSLK